MCQNADFIRCYSKKNTASFFASTVSDMNLFALNHNLSDNDMTNTGLNFQIVKSVLGAAQACKSGLPDEDNTLMRSVLIILKENRLSLAAVNNPFGFHLIKAQPL